MTSYTVTDGNGDQLTISANSLEHAFKVALEQLSGEALPITVNNCQDEKERLLMPDFKAGSLI